MNDSWDDYSYSKLNRSMNYTHPKDTAEKESNSTPVSGYSLDAEGSLIGNQAKETIETTKENPHVFHPNHYTVGGIEVHDVIMAKNLSYDLGNALKYVLRAYYKGQEEQDLEKAINSIAMELARIRKCKKENKEWRPYNF